MDGEYREAVEGLGNLPEAQLDAFGEAAVMMVRSALAGECKDCPCDVCVSVRGTFLGMSNVVR